MCAVLFIPLFPSRKTAPCLNEVLDDKLVVSCVILMQEDKVRFREIPKALHIFFSKIFM